MAETFAFGEPTHARPIASELAWRSLNRGLGHSNNFATLSPLQAQASRPVKPRARAGVKVTRTSNT